MSDPRFNAESEESPLLSGANSIPDTAPDDNNNNPTRVVEKQKDVLVQALPGLFIGLFFSQVVKYPKFLVTNILPVFSSSHTICPTFSVATADT